MVFLVLPMGEESLSSFLCKGSAPLGTLYAPSLLKGADRLLASCGDRVIGPFSIVGSDPDSVQCAVSGPVLEAPYRRMAVPARISDRAASEILGSAGPVPELGTVTGDSRADGLLASSEDGRIRFASEDWEVLTLFTGILDGLGIAYSMSSPFEIQVEDRGLCARCASLPVGARTADDGFMAGFLAPRTSSGRISGCPDWAVGSYGGRVIVSRDRYGNPVVSSMSSCVPPFDRLGTGSSSSGSAGVPESFAFAAAEAVFLSAAELSGYAVERQWSDGLCSMRMLSRGDDRICAVLVSRLSDETAFQLRDHDFPDDAMMVSLDRGMRSAPASRVRPFLSARGLDWSCVSALTGSGPDMPREVAAEAERCLEAVWSAFTDQRGSYHAGHRDIPQAVHR